MLSMDLLVLYVILITLGRHNNIPKLGLMRSYILTNVESHAQQVAGNDPCRLTSNETCLKVINTASSTF